VTGVQTCALPICIPNFWPVALTNNPNISIHAAHHQDQVALSYLEDIWVERNPKERRCFTLEFVRREPLVYPVEALINGITALQGEPILLRLRVKKGV